MQQSCALTSRLTGVSQEAGGEQRQSEGPESVEGKVMAVGRGYWVTDVTGVQPMEVEGWPTMAGGQCGRPIDRLHG